MQQRNTLLAFTALLAFGLQGVFICSQAAAQEAEAILNAAPSQSLEVAPSAPVALEPNQNAAAQQALQQMGGGAYQADVETRMVGIERQMQELTGQIERHGFELNQLTTRLDKFMADIELRFSANNNAAPQAQVAPMAATPQEAAPAPVAETPAATPDVNAPAPANAPTVKPLGTLPETTLAETAPAVGAATGSAEALYENAFSLVKSGNYDAAQREFETFIKDHPDHALASNASYWLGETHFARSDYKRAAKIFAQTFQKYPKGSKSADSLLKLASSFEKLGNKKDSCTTLTHLKKEFPTADAALLRRAEQDLSRLGC